MAIVKFAKCQKTQTVGGLHGVITYCCRPTKVAYQGRSLISGVNCVPQAALLEFMNTKRQYGSTDGRMYYHMVQSFRPDDPVTPEMAHEIALKLAEHIPGYEIIIATHTDREHLHNHFVINSVSYETGLKYHSNEESLMALRKASDELCMQYGLSVVKPKKQKQKKERTMSDREYRAYAKGKSWKMDLEITVDECMAQARSREHFIRLMEYNGYEVKWTDSRKNITYTTPDGHKCCDDKMNGLKYLKEMMEYEFRIRAEICYRNAAGAERYDLESGIGAAHRRRHGSELEGNDRFAESAGGHAGENPGEAGYSHHGNAAGGVHGTAASDPPGRWAGQPGSHRAVPADPEAGSAEHHQFDGEYGEISGATGWEDERGVWECNLAGAGTDEEYFEEAVLDLHDPQPDLGGLGTDAVYLAAGLTNIIDHRPVEDSTTKHFRPERKKHHGQSMGGM
ncbi:MAG: relaxase/mobilization nuclease domain-containing protein [Oscillospiraceae bacterium]|nr:relaxase/mobilization nuclease domain-containing protein [Oscillospiraceae bacterium]